MEVSSLTAPTVVVLTRPEEVRAMVLWAARMARSQATDLVLLGWEPSQTLKKPTPVSKTELEQGNELWTAIGAVLKDPYFKSINRWGAKVFKIQHVDFLKGVLAYTKSHRPSLVIASYTQTTKYSERLWRQLPNNLLLIDFADQDPTHFERMMIPTGGAFTHSVLQLGNKMVSHLGVTMTPLLIEADIGKDARAAALRELKLNLKNAGIKISEGIRPKVALYDRALDGISANAVHSDIILIGTHSYKTIRQLRKIDPGANLPLVPNSTAIAIYRKAAKKSTGLVSAQIDRLFSWIPQLEFTDRVELFQKLKSGSRWNVDFIFMLGLSVGIASLGLITSLPAVIIGGMLIAPLMTPMVGLGLALIQGNIRLAKEAARSIVYGFLLALLISFFLGLTSPITTLSAELLSRGDPSIFDLVVAFLSGAAAAYAMARPKLVGALAGVAVAAALVPPICAVGISVAKGEFSNGQGAAILFSANLVAIILGASFIFRRMGVRGTKVEKGSKLWVRRSILGLSMLSIVLIFPLVYYLLDQVAYRNIAGTATPAVSPEVFKAIEKKVRKHPKISLLGITRPNPDQPFSVSVFIASPDNISPAIAYEIYQIASEQSSQPLRVSVFLIQKHWSSSIGMTEKEKKEIEAEMERIEEKTEEAEEKAKEAAEEVEEKVEEKVEEAK